MVDSLHGFATESFMCDASDTRVYYTTTGWKRYDTIPPAWNWRLGERPFPLTLLGLNDTTAVMCIAGGNRTYFCRYSPTTGWERFYVDTGLIPVRPYFVNDTHGYLAGNMLTKYGGASRYNVIYRTTDKGQSWIKVFQELSFGMISQITFRDNYGLVVGSNTLIYETYDGGYTWHIVPFSPAGEHFTCAAITSRDILVGCNSGTVYRRPLPTLSVEMRPAYKASQLYVYPYPVTDVLTIGGDIDALTRVGLYTQDGRQIFSQYGIRQLDCSHLAAGMYFLRVGNRTIPVLKR